VATCGSRIKWASQHLTLHDQSVCEAAVVVVISDCPDVCGGCTAAASGCETPVFVRKYENPQRHGSVGESVHRYWSVVAGVVALGGLVMLVTRRTPRVQRAAYDDVLLLEEA